MVDAETVVRPVVEGAGAELVDVAFVGGGGRRTLRITVDRDGGLDLDTIAALSEKIARRLDLEGFDAGSYQLEVSSPGIERPLRTPMQFTRAIGGEVKVKTASEIDGARVHQGTLVRANGEGITVDVGSTERYIPYGDMTSARTVADWSAELKGTNA